MLLQAEELLRQLDSEKNDGSERVAVLNKQVRELHDKTERLDSFDTVMDEKVTCLPELGSLMLVRVPLAPPGCALATPSIV